MHQLQDLIGSLNGVAAAPGVTSGARGCTLKRRQHTRRFRQHMRCIPQQGQQAFALRYPRDIPTARRLVLER
jgi:hypothetical protein